MDHTALLFETFAVVCSRPSLYMLYSTSYRKHRTVRTMGKQENLTGRRMKLVGIVFECYLMLFKLEDKGSEEKNI
jgi:hypothetical protein